VVLRRDLIELAELGLHPSGGRLAGATWWLSWPTRLAP